MFIMRVEGVIEKIIYKNDDNGYTVLSLETNDGEEVLVGNAYGLSEGMMISAEGEYVNHPQYDIQFKFTSYEINMPSDEEGIERYLASGIVKGIGKVTAKAIVKKFGNETLNILEKEPERLAEIKGISLNKAKKIAASYHENHEYRDAVIFLTGYDISVNLALKIYKEYKDQVYNIIVSNPYKIAEDIPGVGFKIADDIAVKTGFTADSEYRIRAAIIYVLSQIGFEGHIYLPKDVLRNEVAKLLGINPYDEVYIEEYENIIIDLSIKGSVVIETSPEGVREVYSSWNSHVERYSADKLLSLKLKFDIPEDELESSIKDVERETGIVLDDVQKEAVGNAIGSGVAIITGGPGTGKTTIINAIIKYFKMKGMEVLLAAPTGRAAKRITESTGYEAKTIHRLLEFEGKPDDSADASKLRFMRNEDNPLECDAVIIDEASMIDSFLMYALLRATNYGTRLIMVGDTDQLPSVGAGNVLKDIISSHIFPVTMLTKVFRQQEESDIIKNAHMIREGKHLVAHNKSKDFFYIPKKTLSDARREIEELMTKNLPDYLGIKPEEIQLITPTKKHELGVDAMNRCLQEKMNPPSPQKNEKMVGDTIYRVGDKVMQTKNNYKLEWKIYSDKEHTVVADNGIGIFNGDMGIIKEIDSTFDEIYVEFDDGRVAIYDSSIFDELMHAFAITIHKSQGSEYEAVIIPIYAGGGRLFNRNLIYTAVTRAKRLVVMVGEDNERRSMMQVINRMIDNTEEQERYTGFMEKLIRLGDG